MKNLIFLIIALAFSGVSYAQNADNIIPLSIAYLNYNIDGHGVTISTERSIDNRFVIEAALSAYKHEGNDQSLSFNAYFSRRLVYKSGFSPQFGLGVGIVNTWIDNENSSGQGLIDEESTGNLSASTTIKVSPFGWDFRTKNDFPMRVFFDCILYVQYPEFKSVDTYVLFQLGATYYFKFSNENKEG